MKQRDDYWDTLKWVLMAFVVFGHVLGAAPCPAGSAQMALHNCVYLFHMPLFIFVSGRFSVMHDRRRYLQGIGRLGESYLLFQALLGILGVCQGELTWQQAALRPCFAMWYLLSLVSWRLLVWIVPQRWLTRLRLLTVGICCLVSLAAGLLPVGKELSLQRTLAFLPFFMAGYLTAHFDVRAAVRRIPWLVAVALLALVFALVCHLSGKMGGFLRHTLYYSFPYYTDTPVQLRRCLLARAVGLPLAAAAGLGVLRLVPAVPLLARWGGNTLFIYIAHTFVVKYVLAVSFAKGLLPTGLGWLVGYALAILLPLTLLSLLPVSRVLVNPLSAWRQGRGGTAPAERCSLREKAEESPQAKADGSPRKEG